MEERDLQEECGLLIGLATITCLIKTDELCMRCRTGNMAAKARNMPAKYDREPKRSLNNRHWLELKYFNSTHTIIN